MNKCSYLMACMFSVLYQAAGVCLKVLIVAADADLQRIKYLFLDQSLPLGYSKCRNSWVQPTHVTCRGYMQTPSDPKAILLCLHGTTLKIINSLSQKSHSQHSHLSIFCITEKKCLRQVSVFGPFTKREWHLREEPACLSAV